MEPFAGRGFVLVDLDEGADRAATLVEAAARARKDVILLASRTDALSAGLDLIVRTPVLGVLPKPLDPRAVSALLSRPRFPAAAHEDVLRLLRSREEPRGVLARAMARWRARRSRGRPAP